ncbi:helix-turn-helix transcriptional regulator [Bacillus smithii]|uniref:helix-turn-helix domain-containing protein n=1 Tax=Bacillus smithii TaxID=1479 RepID=UPI002E1ECFDD|nr:helix-turn-helix transcriptional regulator [Bacillus smithii]MED4928165.1 helix-turn-helix transcriptional regulator [Bacillus smithii]
MANTLTKPRLYSPSQIGDILRIARERACQEERRTKRYMAEALGITVDRLTRIENGTAQVPFELAIEWCEIVEDDTALAQIKHIYGMDLPPTDPRLLDSVPTQLANFISQAKQAIEVAKRLLKMSTEIRPGDNLSDSYDLLKDVEEFVDIKQATECVLTSLKNNWKVNMDKVNQNWTQEAIHDRVIIPSVSQFESIRKEIFFAKREGALK